MKKAVTFRIDRDLLDMARRSAAAENRSLTNFIETVLKARFEPGEPTRRPDDRSWAGPNSPDFDAGDRHGR